VEENDLHIQDVGGSPLYWLGPPLEEGSMPAFFFFALCGKRSLLEPSLNKASLHLLQALGKVRIFSFDLPFHKGIASHKASIQMWHDALANGEDFLSPFFSSCKQVIEYLESKETLFTERICIGGISRGGFVALHLAAILPQITHTLLFSPLIDPALPNPCLFHLSLNTLIDRLAGKKIRIHVGNRDEIVYTEKCISFAQKLVNSCYEQRIKPAPIELHLYPSIGYQGHGTIDNSFLEGAVWLEKALKQ
jgi:dienelactone hydrolase